ncbi:DegV family protein [Alkalihalobacillus sp. AL-G]|uniref:DegV family protein n=1 Tax=Alkalihalobacillus sp. AL-G TaxID=2926399 RepID=UPI00272B02B1|nr:DegV family protein [Alkalihalobacillus sp. AL-G]WLD94914.1 DegV family protein [Alkalihalobacillus sp. AL-G]
MSISFVVDSASDYLGQQESLNLRTPIHVVPLNVNFEGEGTYLDGVTITHEDFYDKMRGSKSLPKTSQPSPKRFFDTFQKLISEGHTVIYFAIAGKLSGTYQSANVAKEMFPEGDQKRLFLIDTETVSAGVLYLVDYADQLAEKGLSSEEIFHQVEKRKKDVTGIILLETLENLKKGGRISALQGRIAGILNIKPLLKIKEGTVDTLENFRGKKKGVRKLAEMIQEWKGDHEELIIVHSYPSKHIVVETFKEQFSMDTFKKTRFIKLGSVIGTYASENAIGVIKY